MDKWLVGFIWFLSLMGALFYGFEIARITHKMDQDVANLRLQNCHRLIAGELYERN